MQMVHITVCLLVMVHSVLGQRMSATRAVVALGTLVQDVLTGRVQNYWIALFELTNHNAGI